MRIKRKVMTVIVMMMAMQASARRAEKALQEILHKADHDSNGRVSFFHSNCKKLIFFLITNPGETKRLS